MGEALAKGGPVDAVSVLEIAVTDPHMGAYVSSVVGAGVVLSFLAVVG